MGNPISENIKIGTLGELIVQTRLLQYGVQSAPPLKDSGNDLIAICGEVFKGGQVKTTASGRLRWENLPEHYHILALVDLVGDEDQIYIDKTIVYLVPRSEVENISSNDGSLDKFEICKGLVDGLFNH